MTEADKFLSRWSRLKQEAKRDPEALGDAPGVERVPEIEPEALTAEAKTEGIQEPQFDLSTLPPIESITSVTDIRSFLRKGVPLELTRAALRRAWTADPAIRDFIEVAENQWDFATGKDLPGFGPLEASDDVRRMVEEVFQRRLLDPAEQTISAVDAEGELNQRNLALEEKTALPDTTRLDQSADEECAVSAKGVAAIVRRKEENIATQQESKQTDSRLPAQRRHGRALPQ